MDVKIQSKEEGEKLGQVVEQGGEENTVVSRCCKCEEKEPVRVKGSFNEIDEANVAARPDTTATRTTTSTTTTTTTTVLVRHDSPTRTRTAPLLKSP